MANYRFRFANENDCRLILKFIRSLAKDEKMEDEVAATEALLREQLFEKKKAEVLFVMDGSTEVGFALFFHNFSTSNSSLSFIHVFSSCTRARSPAAAPV